MTSQPTSPRTYEKYVGDQAEIYEKHFIASIGTPSARPVIDAAGLRSGERVLDVACGTGLAARLAAERVGDTGTVTGVDPQPGMLAVARRTSPEIEWRQGSAEDLPLPDESFDAVICSLGLQFFADKVAALQQMRRVLTSGGRAVLGTPGPAPPALQAIDDALTTHVGPEASKFVAVVFSVHDPDQTRELADAAGFDAVDAKRMPLPLRLPPPADFFWQYVYSTPLAGVVGVLDDDAKARLEQDVEEKCQPFVDGDGMTVDSGLLVTVARRD